MIYLHLFIFIITFFHSINYDPLNSDYEPKLLQLITVSRHGARSPKVTIPSKPCPNFKFLNRELTSLGEEQQYALGTIIKQEYSDLVGDSFDPTRVLFRSSYENRALMSAHSFAQGLYGDSSANIRIPVRIFFFFLLFFSL